MSTEVINVLNLGFMSSFPVNMRSTAANHEYLLSAHIYVQLLRYRNRILEQRSMCVLNISVAAENIYNSHPESQNYISEN